MSTSSCQHDLEFMHFLSDVNRSVPRLQKGTRTSGKGVDKPGYLVKNLKDVWKMITVKSGKTCMSTSLQEEHVVFTELHN